MGKKDVQRKRKWKILLVSRSDVTVGYSFHFRLFKSKSSTYHKLYPSESQGTHLKFKIRFRKKLRWTKRDSSQSTASIMFSLEA